VRRALALALGAASLAACAHAPWAERGPRPCAEAWAELGVDGRYDHAREARATAVGNEGYAAYRARAARSSCTKRWSVLLWVDGTGLEPEAVAELGALEAPAPEAWRSGASTLDADVVAELALPEAARRLHLFRAPREHRATRAAELASPIVEVVSSTAAEAARLEAFLRWGVEAYPAEDYVVIAWGRGVARESLASSPWRATRTRVETSSAQTSPVQTSPPQTSSAQTSSVDRVETSTSVGARSSTTASALAAAAASSTVSVDLSERTGVPWDRSPFDAAPSATLEASSLGRALTRVAARAHPGRRFAVLVVGGPAVMSVEAVAALVAGAQFVAGAEHEGAGIVSTTRSIVERVHGASRDEASNDGASNDGASDDGASNDGASNDGAARRLAGSIPRLAREAVAEGGVYAGTAAPARYTSTAVDGVAVETVLVPRVAALGRALLAYVAEDELRKIDLGWLAGPAGAPMIAPGQRDLGVFLVHLEALVEREGSSASSPATDALTGAIAATRAALGAAIVERRFGTAYEAATAGLSIGVPHDRAALERVRPRVVGTPLAPWLLWLDAVLDR
jgi:hypothetical protein